MSKAIKKIVEEARDNAYTELDLADREIKSLNSVPILLQLRQLTRLTLSHNKLTAIPSSIVDLYNLEHLNLFNNFIEELPTTITTLSKLKFLNVGVNRLSSLPRGLGSLPCLEILDLTYNNLNENSLPANFFLLKDSLRALYLGDNDFERLPADFGKLKNLQVLVLRDNDLVELPEELGELTNLKELHLQNNRLTALPPSLGNLQLGEPRHIFKGEGNSWIQAIQDQIVLGITHVFNSLKSDAYKQTYKSHIDSGIDPPPKNEKEKTLKRSRKKVP